MDAQRLGRLESHGTRDRRVVIGRGQVNREVTLAAESDNKPAGPTCGVPVLREDTQRKLDANGPEGAEGECCGSGRHIH